MINRPIIFSAPMILALLDSRKTQTRRVLKKPAWAQDEGWPHKVMDEQELDGSLCWFARETGCLARLPIPQPGDRLWVREACHIDGDQTTYRADMPTGCDTRGWGWKPSIFMPRWASRLTLTVTDVRVQRVQEISEGDALAEGVEPAGSRDVGYSRFHARTGFHALWDSLNAKRGFGWDANPWVAAYTFTVHRCNIDQMDP